MYDMDRLGYSAGSNISSSSAGSSVGIRYLRYGIGGSGITGSVGIRLASDSMERITGIIGAGALISRCTVGISDVTGINGIITNNVNVRGWVGVVAYFNGLTSLSYRMPVINGSSVISLISSRLVGLSMSRALGIGWSSLAGITNRSSVWLLIGCFSVQVVDSIDRAAFGLYNSSMGNDDRVSLYGMIGMRCINSMVV